jgi:acetyltransferase-like isoleucine patch superfamily enzyme
MTRLEFGDNCHLGDNVHIVSRERISIGDNLLCASKVFISDCSHGDYSGRASSSPDLDPNKRPLVSSPVTIGNNVWIGENVCILMGVTIGDGTVIGANSVVTHNIPSQSIVAGAPAKIIKKYSKEAGTWETQAKRV